MRVSNTNFHIKNQYTPKRPQSVKRYNDLYSTTFKFNSKSKELVDHLKENSSLNLKPKVNRILQIKRNANPHFHSQQKPAIDQIYLLSVLKHATVRNLFPKFHSSSLIIKRNTSNERNNKKDSQNTQLSLSMANQTPTPPSTNRSQQHKEYDNSISKSNTLPIIQEQATVNTYHFNKRNIPTVISPSSLTLSLQSSSSSKCYTYIVYPENCGYLIKKCLEYRTNWKESHSQITTIYNFKWKDSTKGFDYDNLSKTASLKQCVNHFEYHSSLSNKAKMFLNLMNYCEENQLNVFNYLPLTIILRSTEDDEYTNNLSNFKRLYHHLTDFLKSSHYYRLKPAYKSFFVNKGWTNNDKLGEKTPLVIPDSHYAKKNYWIVKTPNLNRGRCIKIVNSIDSLKEYIDKITNGELVGYEDAVEQFSQKDKDNDKARKELKYKCKTIIIQKYIECPLLYYQRKFDIRLWVLLTNSFDVYVFKEGHLKTCSVNYDTNSSNSFVHLTNYSLQKHNENFSKFEMGNEVSFDAFQEFIDYCYNNKPSSTLEGHNNNDKKQYINVRKDIFPKFKEIIKVSFQSVYDIINQNKRNNCFEIFGYDFMMDENFNVFLIEINTNPGLEESSDLIKKLVPRMLDDSLRLTIDNIFEQKYNRSCYDENNCFVSPFQVDGYDPGENMWDFVGNAPFIVKTKEELKQIEKEKERLLKSKMNKMKKVKRNGKNKKKKKKKKFQETDNYEKD